MKYITNFNPTIYKNFKNFNFLNKNKIFCKNFILFLFLLKYTNTFFFCNSIIIFVSPFKKNLINVLRAPYKNKLSRHQLSIIRYKINFSIILNTNTINIINLYTIPNFLKKIIYFFNFLESNIIYKNKFIILFSFKFNFFFNLY